MELSGSMRMIDADALMRKTRCIKNGRRCEECDFFKDGDSWCDSEVYGTTIMQMPTIDAEPVKHGKWVEHGDAWYEIYYECSVCGESFVDGNPLESGMNYCNNCGAKMDLEVEE